MSDSAFSLNNSMNAPIKTVTSNYIATLADFTILVDAGGGAVTLTLPAASSASSHLYNIKKIDSSANIITIQANAAELIYNVSGSNTLYITSQGSAAPIHCDGIAWYVNQ